MLREVRRDHYRRARRVFTHRQAAMRSVLRRPEKWTMTPEILARITNGDQDASAFLAAFVAHCHVLDDLIDKDKPCDDERLIKSEITWLYSLSANLFFLKNRHVLVPLITQGFNAWLDSNKMDAGAVRDVVKGFYHEVVWHVAFICGGWDHMRAITKELRAYDLEAR